MSRVQDPNSRPWHGWTRVVSKSSHGEIIELVPDLDDDEMVHTVGLDPRDGEMCLCVPYLNETEGTDPDRLYHRGLMHRLADEVNSLEAWPVDGGTD